MTLDIAIAQINCTVGDLSGNRSLIAHFAKQAAHQGADIVLTPELSLTGYPPEDLVFQKSFYDATKTELEKLCVELSSLKGLYVVVGHHRLNDGKCYNTCSVLHEGHIVATYDKQALPNDAVFDEKRYFHAGEKSCIFTVKNHRLALLICEDIWQQAPTRLAHAAGADILLVANSSPYSIGKQHLRLETVREHVSTLSLPCVYANMTGAQDELVFDGNSFVTDDKGNLLLQMPHCTQALKHVVFENKMCHLQSLIEPISDHQAVYEVLVTGVRDYIEKNGFSNVIIGLSGGVDSALVLAIAVDALGKDHVRAVMMPSKYTSDISTTDAAIIAKNLGVRYDTLAIEPCYNAFMHTLEEQFKGSKPDATEENLQARIRGTLLMALSNKTGALVLTTGNKSETAVGYCTLYGDMAGGFAVIKDVYKTLVYKLCHYRNSISNVIPERIITRAPSAELRFDQCDQDSLPPYEILDKIISAFMEQSKSIDEITAMGIDKETVIHVITLLKRNEYKRRQAPIGTRITSRGFGRDWRYPLTSKFKY